MPAEWRLEDIQDIYGEHGGEIRSGHCIRLPITASKSMRLIEDLLGNWLHSGE